MAVGSAAVNQADIPISVEVDKTKHLKVAWEDGVQATWELADLRLSCPCAGCRSRRDQGLRSVPDDGKPVAATAAQFVGSYAVSIDWVDGRCSSIFSFDLLREWAARGLTSD